MQVLTETDYVKRSAAARWARDDIARATPGRMLENVKVSALAGSRLPPTLRQSGGCGSALSKGPSVAPPFRPLLAPKCRKENPGLCFFLNQTCQTTAVGGADVEVSIGAENDSIDATFDEMLLGD